MAEEAGFRATSPERSDTVQKARLAFQMGFFVLFIFAPVFDLLRFDLTRGHAYLLGFEWRLGLDDFFAGRIDAVQAGANILLRLFLPVRLLSRSEIRDAQQRQLLAVPTSLATGALAPDESFA